MGQDAQGATDSWGRRMRAGRAGECGGGGLGVHDARWRQGDGDAGFWHWIFPPEAGALYPNGYLTIKRKVGDAKG